MQTKILSIESIDLNLFKSNPSILQIISHGIVSSMGWTNPKLIPYVYVTEPSNGIWEFDFIADPPLSIAATVLTPIFAKIEWQDFPKSLKGIKVYASSNSLVESLTDSKELTLSGGGSGNPRGLFID